MKTQLIVIVVLLTSISADFQIKLLNDSKLVKVSTIREKSNLKLVLVK
jgi:hypothetical protein